MGNPFAFAQLGAFLAACNTTRETTTRVCVEHLVSSGRAQVHTYGTWMNLGLLHWQWLRHNSRCMLADQVTDSTTGLPLMNMSMDAAPLLEPASPEATPGANVIAFPRTGSRD